MANKELVMISLLMGVPIAVAVYKSHSKRTDYFVNGVNVLSLALAIALISDQ
jgi:hypothetical protein